MRLHHRIVLIAAFSFSLVVHAANECRLRGVVEDESRNPVANARVVLTREGTEYRHEVSTEDDGSFRMLILDTSGKYHVHIDKEGFVPVDEPITPAGNDILRLTYTLKAAPQTK